MGDEVEVEKVGRKEMYEQCVLFDLYVFIVKEIDIVVINVYFEEFFLLKVVNKYFVVV